MSKLTCLLPRSVAAGSRLRLLALAVLVACPATCMAQAIAPLPMPTASSRQPRRQAATFDLRITPAAEPVPALKHRFFAPPNRLQAGSAERAYMRAVILLKVPHVHDRWAEYGKAQDSENNWTDGPLSGERLAAAKKWLAGMPLQPVLGELRRAARLRDNRLRLDLGDLPLEEMFAVLLPEIQDMRSVARLLAVDIRVAIAEGRYEDAVERLGLGFRMADAFSESDLIISRLIGIAIGWIMTDAAQQLAASPDAPNLYWALATLPTPLVPTDGSVRSELEHIKAFLSRELEDAEGLTARQWTDKVVALAERLDQLDGGGNRTPDLQRSLIVTAGIAVSYPKAKRWLHEQGYQQQRIEAMPTAEAVLRWSEFEISRVADDLQKWTLLPRSVRRQHIETGQTVFDRYVREGSKVELPRMIATLLMPAYAQVIRAETRLQLHIDMLQTAEALRAHAAAHGGAFPASLDDLSPLPALPNPRTGEPFEYRLEQGDEGPVAVLSATDSDREAENRILRLRVGRRPER